MAEVLFGGVNAPRDETLLSEEFDDVDDSAGSLLDMLERSDHGHGAYRMLMRELYGGS